MPVLFALSLSKYVNSAGTDIGFASLLAVALLAVLYFAGARESRTLRDELEDAHERISGLEARVAALMRSQSPRRAENRPEDGAPEAPRPAVVSAPSFGAVSATGSGAARVTREEGAVGTAGLINAAALTRTPGATTTAGATGLLGAPAGAGAPSLGSATTAIPVPVPVPSRLRRAAVPASSGATAVSAAPVGAADLEDDDESFDLDPEDTMYVGASATVAATGGVRGRARVPLPAARDEADEEEPGGPPPRGGFSLNDPPRRPRGIAGRLLGAVAALLLLAGVVVALLAITSSGGSNTVGPASLAGVKTTVTHRRTIPSFRPVTVKVSVLNGTAVGGLASAIGRQLSGAGYTVPPTAVTNAAAQTVTTTTVGYQPGFRADAFHVAQSLSRSSGVAVTAVAPADPAAVTSCATPTGSGQAGTCPAQVIVTVGSDLASAASASTTSTTG